MLDLLDVIKRYNDAKSNEDDMIKDIELQKIQADFKANNEFIESSEKIIRDKEDEINALKLDNERLRDSNAQLRLQIGSKVETKQDDNENETDEKEVEEVPTRTLDEIAHDF